MTDSQREALELLGRILVPKDREVIAAALAELDRLRNELAATKTALPARVFVLRNWAARNEMTGGIVAAYRDREVAVKEARRLGIRSMDVFITECEVRT